MNFARAILFAAGPTALLAGLLGGCASGPSNASTTTPSPAVATSAAATVGAHAECLVCKKNADLACVDVTVDSQTPTYVYNGKTYYFCSTECRNEFAKNPTKFAGK